MLPVTLIYDQCRQGTQLIRGGGEDVGGVWGGFQCPLYCNWLGIDGGWHHGWLGIRQVCVRRCGWLRGDQLVWAGLGRAAETVIKATLKGAFHCFIEAAGAALLALSLSKAATRSYKCGARTHARSPATFSYRLSTKIYSYYCHLLSSPLCFSHSLTKSWVFLIFWLK